MTVDDTRCGGTTYVATPTDVATIVVYDPTLLRERIKVPSTWWSANPLGTTERAEGKLACWPLGGRGGRYRVRLGVGDLTDGERAYARGASDPAPLLVTGPEVFLGPIERLPGNGYGDRLPAIPDGGCLMPFAPGRYAVRAHVLDWRPEPRFWDQENEPTADAPPDFVILAAPVDALPAPPPAVVPLLELLPHAKPQASSRVVHATRPRPAPEPEPAAPGRRRKREPRAGAPPPPPPLRPGEMGIGSKVRHAAYGVGKVLFLREGFPKVRVAFPGGEQKVPREELTLME